MSRRRLLLTMAGLAGAAAAGRVLGTDGALAGGGRAPLGAPEHERDLLRPSGERDDADLMCPGVSLYEATLHGDETLVLPAVDRWRELTGLYPFILPLWSPFDLDLPAPRGNIFPADWLMAGLRDRGIEPAIFAHSADEPRWETHGYEAILRGKRDEALEEWGLAAARYRHRLIFRWDQEMNGKFPWSDRPARDYVAVFRHVSERIRRVAGAGNVEFHFCPGLRREAPGMDTIESYYPGDEWCQHVGFDGYSRTTDWMPLAEQWGPLIDRFRSISRRPVVVGEFGRRIDLGDRDGWLRSLRDVRGVSAVVYFDMNLAHFEAPAHHWLMDRPMREVYANLPRCERSIAKPEPSPTAEASATPEPSSAPASPSPSLGPSASPSANNSPSQSPGPSG